MSNNRERNNENVNKITILNINGKRIDREKLIELIDSKFIVEKRNNKDLSQCSTRQIIRKIEGCESQYQEYLPDILLFENLSSNIVNNIGDELGNMIIDIHLNKFNKSIKNEQIKECLELLEKL